MKIICNQENTMNEKRGWDLDTIWIKENKTSVYDKFMSDIKFENNRYTVPKIDQYYRTILPDFTDQYYRPILLDLV